MTDRRLEFVDGPREIGEKRRWHRVCDEFVLERRCPFDHPSCEPRQK
jgi:hypothetical protein